MSDLDELYQEVILDHTKNPRNYGKLEATIHQARVIIRYVEIELLLA